VEVLAAFLASMPFEGRTVIHNYGPGGTGYQTGYSMAVDAAKAAEPLILETKIDSTVQNVKGDV
jgi:hypothetical protein